MADKELRYIVDWRNNLLAVLPNLDSMLIFITDEKRWGVHDRTFSQIVGASIYESGRDYDDITHEKAKEIFKDCPPDGWLPRENENYYDWWVRITPESEKERIRNSKKRINRMELQVISEETYKDESSEVRKTTIVYECPCGKGKFYYTKEHTGFDDWYTSLSCDDCKKMYLTY